MLNENEVSSIAYIYTLIQMTDRVNVGKQVTYVDPTMAHIGVNKLGAIMYVLRCHKNPTYPTKRPKLWASVSLVRQLRQELAAIRAGLETKNTPPRVSKRN